MNINDPSSEDLHTLFAEAIKRGVGSGIEQAIGFGGNWRFNLVKALQSVYAGVKIGVKAVATHATGGALAPLLLTVPADAYTFVVSGIQAVFEKLDPLSYACCVVLSSTDGGMDKEKLKAELVAFLDACKNKEIAWWTRLTVAAAENAHNQLPTGGMEDALTGLLKGGYVTLDGDGKYKLKEKNFELGFKAI